MELRKDPITRSWVIQLSGGEPWEEQGACLLCAEREAGESHAIYEHPYGSPNWQVRVIPHFRPLYSIEGGDERRAEGIYDRMRNLGAHEIVIESPDHNARLAQQTDEQVAQVVRAYVARLTDLKRDERFRYVTLFRNHGALAGQDFEHPHSQITATPFIPRRVGYELRSSARHFQSRARCLICDIVKYEMKQQIRAIESDDLFLAFCPYASRVPYETWLLPVQHHSAFELDVDSWDRQIRFARFFKSVLSRLTMVAPAYHLVLHTAPNVDAKYDRATNWRTLAEDYHWHFEILPVVPSKAKSYSLKEVYYNPLRPEDAARELRGAAVPVG